MRETRWLAGRRRHCREPETTRETETWAGNGPAIGHTFAPRTGVVGGFLPGATCCCRGSVAKETHRTHHIRRLYAARIWLAHGTKSVT